MKRIGLLLVLMGWACLAKAQLTLEACYAQAEAIVENMTIITKDTIIPNYPVKTLW